MYSSAALSGVSAFAGLPALNDIKDRARIANPDDPSGAANAAQTTFWILAALFLLSALVWVWTALSSGQGKSWARTVATVLFALSTIALFFLLFRNNESYATPGSVRTLATLGWLAGAGALYFLYNKESSEFFRRFGLGGSSTSSR